MKYQSVKRANLMVSRETCMHMVDGKNPAPLTMPKMIFFITAVRPS